MHSKVIISSDHPVSPADVKVHKVRQALAQSRPGYALPQVFYCDQDIYEADVEAVFFREWLFIANECEIPDKGDYLTVNIDRAPIIVLRDRESQLRAFHNSCRHRGSKLCTAGHGNTNLLVCPYHQWTYDLDGSLVSARHMNEDFKREDFPLQPVQLQNVEGMIYICLSDNPPDFAAYRRTITPYIAPHQPSKTKVAYESTIIDEANWKLVIENNRECYHCSAAHPELLVSFLEMAVPGDDANDEKFEIIERKNQEWEKLGLPYQLHDGEEFRCVRYPFRKGMYSMTRDGQLACKKLLGDLVEHDLGSVRMFRTPNNPHHFLSDHIVHMRVLPLGPNRTEVRTTWLVHEDAIEGWDYDPDTVAEVWLATNDQDRRLAEENQRGIRSPSYKPGPYSEIAESMVIKFTAWYREKLGQYLNAP